MITIGSDPEFFLGNDSGFVPAYGRFPGTKYEPHPVERGSIQVDGVAAEINTLPCKSFHEFRDNITSIITQFKALVPHLKIIPDTTVTVDLSSTPAEALELSCQPDFDPYTEDMNMALDEGSDKRSAGGHIHIGGIFTEGMGSTECYSRSLRLARLMDKYVGVYSLIWDKDNHRRSTYGKAGNCRLKDYGIEYRCLSNAWLFNDAVMEFVYNQTLKAVAALEAGEDVDDFYRNIINNSQVGHEFFNTDEVAKEVKALC